MTTALTSDQLPLQAASLWAWLLDCAAAVARALRAHRPLTQAQRQVYRMAEELGSSVLDAEDIADLHIRLHAVARSERLLVLEAAALSELDAIPAPDALALEAGFTSAWGETHLVRECARLVTARLALVAQIFESVKGQRQLDALSGSLADPLSDFRTPPVVRSLLEETLVGEAALIALVAPLVDPTRWRCDPWLRLALLEQVRLSSVSHLRLLSILPGLTIPEDVLPREEYLNAAELDAEGRELARYVLPSELRVSPKYVDLVLAEVEGTSPPPPGVLALFAD